MLSCKTYIWRANNFKGKSLSLNPGYGSPFKEANLIQSYICTILLVIVPELRKPASSTITLVEHSVILQEHFDCQHSKFTFLSKIQPNFKRNHSIISQYLYCLCIPQLSCQFTCRILCVFTWKSPGTHNDIQNACGTPHHFSQLCPTLPQLKLKIDPRKGGGESSNKKWVEILIFLWIRSPC